MKLYAKLIINYRGILMDDFIFRDVRYCVLSRSEWGAIKQCTIAIYHVKITIYNSNSAMLNTQLFLVSYNLAIVHRGVGFSARNPRASS